MFVNLKMVAQIMSTTTLGQECRALAMLCLAAYVFLLRVPSEALLVGAHECIGQNMGTTPVLNVHSEKLELTLPKRKHRLQPTTLFRSCWCAQCTATCPVHVLGKFFLELPSGAQPFVHMKPHVVMEGLRTLLEGFGVPNARLYRTHDLRRGHAEDLRLGGATLGEILRAGDWKSPAFLHYLNQEQLELDRTVEAHLHDSSDDA